MDLRKLRRGELIAAIGGLSLLFTLFFVDWYSAGASVQLPLGTTVNVSGDFGAWDGEGFLGFIANLVILAAALAAVGLGILTATARTVALPVAASAITASLGIAAVGMVLLRMIFQPGPNELIDLKFGILLALAASLIVAYGGGEAMKEEGTTFDSARDQLQSRYARRPAPPPGPATEPERSAPTESLPASAPESAPPPEAGGESRPPPAPPADRS
jgi:hypothetical protein